MSSRLPRVAIVVLNWNSWEHTLRCVASLQGLSYPSYRVVIVDNGSTDDSVNILRQRLPQVQVLALDQNLGFSGGMNRGIEWALAHDAEFVFLLNNDAIVASDTLTRLVEAALAHPEVGLLGCAVQHEMGATERKPVVKTFDWLQGVPRTVQPPASDGEPLSVDFVSGSAMLARREAVERAGLMDERYFLYFEDLDWALRIRHAGYRCLFVPRAFIWHYSGASTWGDRAAPNTTVYYYFPRNNVLFMRTHGSRWTQWTFVPFFLARTLATALGIVLSGPVKRKPRVSARLQALAAGFIDGWLGRTGARRMGA